MKEKNTLKTNHHIIYYGNKTNDNSKINWEATKLKLINE